MDLNIFWKVFFTISSALLARSTDSTLPSNYHISGDAVFAVFGGLHQLSESDDQNHTVIACGEASWRGLQQAAAAEWALNTINNQTTDDYHIGLEVIDTCADPVIAAKQLTQLLLKTSKENNPPLMGVISVGTTEESAALLPMLTKISVPMLVTSPEAAYDLEPTDALFASAPHLQAQMQTIIASIGHMMGTEAVGMPGPGTRIAVMWSSHRAASTLQSEANKAGLVITLTRQVTHSAATRRSDVPLYRQIVQFVADNNLHHGDIVVLLLKVHEAHALTRGEGRYALSKLNVKWLLTSLEDDPLSHELDILQMNEALRGLIVVGPHGSHLHALQSQLSQEVCKFSPSSAADKYAYRSAGNVGSGDEAENVNISNQSNQTAGNQLYDTKNAGDTKNTGETKEAKESVLSPLLTEYCQMLKSRAHTLIFANHTGGETVIMRDDVSVDASHTASMLRAVSSLTAALRLGQLRVCDTIVNCTEKLRPHLGEHMIESLSQLSFTTDDDTNRLRYTADARLLTTFNVVTVKQGQLSKIGVYREQTGMEWVDDLMFSSESNNEFSLSEPLKSNGHVHVLKNNNHHSGHDSWKSNMWSVAISGTAAVGIVFCVCVFTYGAVRYCEGTLLASQPFSTLIILGSCGVLVSSILLVLPTVTFSELTLMCCLQHIMPYVSLAVIYASLLIKGLQLKLQNAFENKKNIPWISIYLPLAALLSLAVVLAALGDQTTLHLLLPNEISAHHTDNNNNNGIIIQRPTVNPSSLVAGHQDRIVTLPLSIDYNANDDVTYHSIHICKRLDQLPAIIGFTYLVLMLVVAIILHVTLGTTSQTKEEHVHESRRSIAICGISIPIVILWGGVSLYVPVQYQGQLSSLCLLILAYVIVFGYVFPKLRQITSKANKQFSHKPLSGLQSAVSTVYSSSPSVAFRPSVSFSSSSTQGIYPNNSSAGSSINRFAGILTTDNHIEKYKLQETPPKNKKQATYYSNYRETVVPYSIPRIMASKSEKIITKIDNQNSY